MSINYFPYRMVIFDVDGTLLDTSEGLLSSIKYAIQKHGLKELTNEVLLTFIGPPIQDSLRKYYNLSENKIQQITNTFRTHYKTKDLFKATPYDNVFDVFDKLYYEGITIAVATYKREDYAVMLMQYFNFDRYTNIIYGADNSNKLKKSDIIRKCIDRAPGISENQILVVGDSNSDGVGAKTNSCAFCGVTYGFGAKSENDFKVETNHVINNIGEILTWF